TAGQAPPKREQREQEDAAERAADNGELAQPRIPRARPQTPRARPHSPFPQAGRRGDRRGRADASNLAVLPLGLMPAQLVLEAFLQLYESLETGIRVPVRHAPTWRPLDYRFRPRHR